LTGCLVPTRGAFRDNAGCFSVHSRRSQTSFCRRFAPPSPCPGELI
jgi:hypothetical protein